MDWDKLRKQLADGERILDEDIAGLGDAFAEARRVITKLRSKRRAEETAEISPEEKEPFLLLVERLDDTAPESGERELVMRRLDDELQNLCRGRSLISPITHESKQAIAVALEEVIFSCEDAEEQGEGFEYVLSRLKTFRLIAESKPDETTGEHVARAVEEAGESVEAFGKAFGKAFDSVKASGKADEPPGPPNPPRGERPDVG